MKSGSYTVTRNDLHKIDFNEASNHSCTNKLWMTKIYCQEFKEIYKKSYETNSKLVNKKGY